MEITVNNIKITLTQDQIDQIVKENSKPKEIKWKDFGKVKGYYINENSLIQYYEEEFSYDESKNVFPTKEEAEACIVLSQLCQWRDKYNENWKPDWTDVNEKYVIYFNCNKAETDWVIKDQRILTFKTQQIRDKFLEDFHSLIEIAKYLL